MLGRDDLKLLRLLDMVSCECDVICGWLTELRRVRRVHPNTFTSARECRLRGATTDLRPSSVRLLQESRLRERSAVRAVSTRSPSPLKMPLPSFSVRRRFRCLCT